jgi:hypothetical protein
VSAVFLIESVITIFAFHGFWVGATLRGGDLSTVVAIGQGGQQLIPDPLWSFKAMAPLTGLGEWRDSFSKGVKLIVAVSSLTHSFYCWRIWAVSKTMIIPVMVVLVSAVRASHD